MLLGTDVPYVEVSETIPMLDSLDLSPEEHFAVNTGNAMALFPRLRHVLEENYVVTSPSLIRAP
jgi:hypothetical protein